MIYPNSYKWGEKSKEYFDKYNSNKEYDDDYNSMLKKMSQISKTKSSNSEIPNLEENSFHLVKVNDLVYMVEIILKMNSCIRVRFLENVPPKFKPNSINGEAWVPISDLSFLENIDKNMVRTIKINSIVSNE